MLPHRVAEVAWLNPLCPDILAQRGHRRFVAHVANDGARVALGCLGYHERDGLAQRPGLEAGKFVASAIARDAHALQLQARNCVPARKVRKREPAT